uniref:hypothetical protein n=1 Tax=Malonomonas rubra TaxID=57040 RepID=UPI0026E95BC0
SLKQGEKLATALGLNTFHTWDATEIKAWAVAPDRMEPLWIHTAPAEDLNTPETFQILIGKLLADIQQRFFNDQLNLPRLSAVYIANLLQTAFDEIHADLPRVNSGTSSSQQLTDSLLRRLIQVLALVAEAELPRIASMATLIEQLDAATEQLPKALASSLGIRHDPARFQGSAARRLQHLAVLLSQFGNALRPLLADTLEILKPGWAKRLQHYPAPTLPDGDAPLLLVFADSIPDNEPFIAQIGAGGILACDVLLRYLRELPPPSLQLSDPLRLAPPLAIGRIVGTLAVSQRSTAAEVRMLKARLRSSWPNRNLTLATSAPLWHWHLLHLAGLLSPPARLSLALPADWLSDKNIEALYTLLSERLCLSSVAVHDESWHHVIWTAGTDSGPVRLRSRDGRESTLQADGYPSLTRLRVALLLPAPLTRLVERGELQLYDDINGLSPTAARLFLRSTPGKVLWQLLLGKQALPGEEKLLAACCAHGIPLPRPEMLSALAKLARQYPAPTSLQIDHEVADWLGNSCLQVSAEPRSATSHRLVNDADTDAMIIAAATRDGILRFPEDFLYNVPETQRLNFTATPPLQVIDTFFDSITLEASSGEQLHVEGEATARALVLATSLGERPLALPTSSWQTENILERYASHLYQLRSALETAAAACGSEHVQVIVDRIWGSLPVPPWDLLQRHLPQTTKVVV